MYFVVLFFIKLILFIIFNSLIKAGPNIIHFILLNKTLRVLITMIVISVLAPSAVYMIFFSREIIYTIDRYGGTCSHAPIHHVPCGDMV